MAGTAMRRARWLAVAALAVAVVALGCGGPDGGRAQPPVVDTAVGCDPGVDRAFEAWGDRGAGFSVVDVGGERECVEAYGLADLDTGRPNTTDTVYSIGSITKAITAAAIFDLVDAGVIALDDTAGQHIDDLSGRPPTSRSCSCCSTPAVSTASTASTTWP